MKNILKTITALSFILGTSSAFAQNTNEKVLSIQIIDHKFQPAVIEAPVNQKFKLAITNLDSTLEEFESNDLKREKLISGKKKVIINMNALQPGEYKFFGDFHKDTAQGKIIVKAAQ